MLLCIQLAISSNNLLPGLPVQTPVCSPSQALLTLRLLVMVT